jgi:hypothetical protein
VAQHQQHPEPERGVHAERELGEQDEHDRHGEEEQQADEAVAHAV